MEYSLSAKTGYLTLFFFILSAAFGTLYYVSDFVKMKGLITTRTTHRYAPLERYFNDSPIMMEWIENNKNRPNMYKQVVWHIIDSLAIRVIDPGQNLRSHFLL